MMAAMSWHLYREPTRRAERAVATVGNLACGITLSTPLLIRMTQEVTITSMCLGLTLGLLTNALRKHGGCGFIAMTFYWVVVSMVTFAALPIILLP
jgi:hypothetical protein